MGSDQRSTESDRNHLGQQVGERTVVIPAASVGSGTVYAIDCVRVLRFSAAIG
jgi:hypothetical protein